MKLILLFLSIFTFSTLLGQTVDSTVVVFDSTNCSEFTNDTLKVGHKLPITYIYYYHSPEDQNSQAIRIMLTFLKCNPHITVQIVSHTDSRGSNSYNLELSQKRAEEIMKKLIAAGIPKSRVTARGAGETELKLADDYIRKNASTKPETELLHQQNRRTELVITSVDYKN